MRAIDGVTWAYLLGGGLVVGLLAYSPRASDRTADGRVVVTYWEKWTGAEYEAIRQAVRGFNRSQDGIEVRVFSISQVAEKVKVAAAGGDPPDLAGLFAFNVPGFAEQDALLPLDELLASAGVDPDIYEPNYVQFCRYRGRLWALPTTPATHALYYNTAVFRKEASRLRGAGLDPNRAPRTIAELDAYSRVLTRRDAEGRIVRVGFLPIKPGYFHLEAYFDGNLMRGGRITATDSGVVAALQWIDGLADQYGRDDLDAFLASLGQPGSQRDPFFTGAAVMVLQGVWLAQFIRANGPPGFEWAAVPFPTADQKLGQVSVVDTDVIAIPSGARHVQEAVEFLKYLATPAGIEPVCRAHFKQSPLRRASADFYRSHPNPQIVLFRDLGRSGRACRSPAVSIWPEYLAGYLRAYEQVWTGQREPLAALQELQERMARRWARAQMFARRGPRP